MIFNSEGSDGENSSACSKGKPLHIHYCGGIHSGVIEKRKSAGQKLSIAVTHFIKFPDFGLPWTLWASLFSEGLWASLFSEGPASPPEDPTREDPGKAQGSPGRAQGSPESPGKPRESREDFYKGL